MFRINKQATQRENFILNPSSDVPWFNSSAYVLPFNFTALF